MCTVRASQAGSATWNPATADRSFTVSVPTASSQGDAPTAGAAGQQATTGTGAIRATVISARPRPARGRAVRVTLKVTNTGTGSLAGVTGCVATPGGFRALAASGGTRTGRTTCFAMGDLMAGAETTRWVTLRASSPRRVLRRVTATVRAQGVASVSARSARIAVLPR